MLAAVPRRTPNSFRSCRGVLNCRFFPGFALHSAREFARGKRSVTGTLGVGVGCGTLLLLTAPARHVGPENESQSFSLSSGSDAARNQSRGRARARRTNP